jgi:hypothetical protein
LFLIFLIALCGVETTTDAVVSTTVETTMAPGTTVVPGESVKECHILSGFGFEVVQKWDFGEQIKISTTFDTDINSPLSLRDESFIKVRDRHCMFFSESTRFVFSKVCIFKRKNLLKYISFVKGVGVVIF